MFPLKDTQTSRGLPFWVVIIIAINIYVFYLELTSPNIDALIDQYALIPALINFNDLSTLTPFITSQFLHVGFLHIISNMWFLWIFGDNVEGKLGNILFPIFYLASGLVGSFMQYSFSPTIDIPMLGASAAIAGVLGAYLAIFPNNRVKTLIFIVIFITIIDLPASILLFYWFVIQLFSGTQFVSSADGNLGGIAYLAHIGGFIFGWVIGKIASLIPSNSLVNKS